MSLIKIQWLFAASKISRQFSSTSFMRLRDWSIT